MRCTAEVEGEGPGPRYELQCQEMEDLPITNSLAAGEDSS